MLQFEKIYTPSPYPGKHPLAVARIPPRGHSCYLQRSPDPVTVMGWDQDMMTPSLGSANTPGPKFWINACTVHGVSMNTAVLLVI